MPRHAVRAIVVLSLLTSTAWAADFQSERLENWHRWRGPNGDGVAPEGNPPVTWDAEKNVSWKVEIPGRGSASPIVWGDRVFVLTAVPGAARDDAAQQERRAERPQAGGSPRRSRFGGRGGPGGRGGFGANAAPRDPHKFMVICLDRQTGRVLWERTAAEEVPHEGGHETNTFASGSPVTDGEHLYVSFGSRGVFCYDLDGDLQWKRDLGDMQTRNAFGEGSSPALHEDTLVVNWDHEGDSFIAALDARSGETRWKVPRDERTTWATPLIVEHNGRTQVITNGTRVRSYDLATGDLIWECGGQAGNPIPSPIVRDGVAYCMTGFRGYAVYAIPLDSRGDVTGSDKVLWHRDDTGPYISSAVLYDDFLYVTNERRAILNCLKAETGETVYGPARLPGLSTLYSSPVAAAGRIYYSDRGGNTLVLEHGPELKVLATNNLGEGIDASPAIVGTQMFVRGTNHLYCLEDR